MQDSAVTNARANNVLTLRYLLALGVVYFHAQAWQGNPHFFNYPFVPAFMALSGVLVLQSRQRSATALEFAIKRFRRIYPALGIAFLLALPLSASPGPTLLWYASGGISGDGRAMYPSWSLMWEQGCYALLIALFALRIYNHRTVVLMLTLAAIGLAVVWHPPTEGGMRAPTLVACFLLGNTIHLWSDKLKDVPVLVTLVLAASGFFDYHIGSWSVFSSAIGCTMWALTPGSVGSWINSKVGDASVGLYLFHWPILQYLRLVPKTMPWDILLIFPATFSLAFLSWRFVEKPIISLGQRRNVEQSGDLPMDARSVNVEVGN